MLSVGVNVAFPLAFVAGRSGKLPLIALAVLAVQVPLAWALGAWLELDGLALALALSTLLALGALLREVHALGTAARGLMAAVGVVAGVTVAAFLPPALVLGSLAAGAVGLVLYAVLIVVVRPRGLRASWAYLRALG